MWWQRSCIIQLHSSGWRRFKCQSATAYLAHRHMLRYVRGPSYEDCYARVWGMPQKFGQDVLWRGARRDETISLWYDVQQKTYLLYLSTARKRSPKRFLKVTPTVVWSDRFMLVCLVRRHWDNAKASLAIEDTSKCSKMLPFVVYFQFPRILLPVAFFIYYMLLVTIEKLMQCSLSWYHKRMNALA